MSARKTAFTIAVLFLWFVGVSAYAGGGGRVLSAEAIGPLYPSPHGKEKFPEEGFLIQLRGVLGQSGDVRNP